MPRRKYRTNKNVIRIANENRSHQTQTSVWFYWNVLTLVWGSATALRLDPGTSSMSLSLPQLFHPLFFPHGLPLTTILKWWCLWKQNKTKLPVLPERVHEILKLKAAFPLEQQKPNHMNFTSLYVVLETIFVDQIYSEVLWKQLHIHFQLELVKCFKIL